MDGEVTVAISSPKPARFSLHLRIPGWAQNNPVPGDLYAYTDGPLNTPVRLKINGAEVKFTLENGFAVIERIWQPGDEIQLNLPMEIQRIVCNENVSGNIGKIALERGPLVYCFEGVDNGSKLENLTIPDSTGFYHQTEFDLLGGIGSLIGIKQVNGVEYPIRAIPYFAWCNRGPNKMKVWVERE